MRLEIRVIPNAKKAKVEDLGGKLKVHLSAPPHDGKANKELIEILSGHFKVRKNKIKLIKGEKSRDKVVELTHE